MKNRFEPIKKISPYFLNIIYLLLSLFGLVGLFINYMANIFNYDIEMFSQPSKSATINILFSYCLGVIWFIVAIVISYTTKLSRLRFISLYLSGQIYVVVLMVLCMLSFTPLYSLIFVSIISILVFLGEKKRQLDNDKTCCCELNISTYSLNIIYLCFVSLVMTAGLADYFSNNYSRIGFIYDKYIISSFFGILLFSISIMVAYKTKHKWLHFLSLYLLGQIYIVAVIIYVIVMNKFIIPR